MPELKFVPLVFNPGIDRENTSYSREGTWYDADKVRFYQGFPRKFNGWTKYSTNTFEGTARQLITWQDLDSRTYLGLGTECLLYVENGGIFYDITPITTAVSVSNVVSTSAGSTRVVVSGTFLQATGDYVVITSMAATVGGNVLLDGRYEASLIGSGSFAIESSVTAVATSLSTGAINLAYLLQCGASSNVAAFGWGAGTWGESTWGTPRVMSNIILGMRQWSLDNFGEDLLAVPKGGALYRWNTSAGVSASPNYNRASIVVSAPDRNNFMLVTDDRHVMTFGTENTSGNFDPLLIRWSSQEDYNDWTASATNTAGDYRVQNGSGFQGCLKSKSQYLSWTDTALYGTQFTGPPFTFGTTQLGINCGLVGPHAAVDVNGVVYWMSQHNFHVYDGVVRNLPCTVLRYVLEGIDDNQLDKIFAGVNTEFSEIIWFYPTRDTGEITRYVIYNFKDGNWTIGSMTRSAWNDQGINQYPIATGLDGYIYFHDIHNDYNADGQPMDAWIESAQFDMGDGDNITFADRIVPDFNIEGSIDITLYCRKYPQASAVITKGPYTVQADTGKISIRARGRTMAVRVGASAVGSFFEMGKPLLRVKPDGEQ